MSEEGVLEAPVPSCPALVPQGWGSWGALLMSSTMDDLPSARGCPPSRTTRAALLLPCAVPLRAWVRLGLLASNWSPMETLLSLGLLGSL